MTAPIKRLFGVIGLILTALAVYIVLGVALSAQSIRRATALAHIAGLQVSYLLDPTQLADLGRLDENFDVTSSGMVIVKSGNELLGIESASGKLSLTRLALKSSQTSSFAVDEGDGLLTVADGYLGMLGEDDESSHAIPLPYDDAHLARSVHDGVIYLFGGKAGDYRLYRFIDDGTFQVLLKSGDPIVAVSDTDDAVYAATASEVVRIELDGPTVIFQAPDETNWGPIVSLAASADKGLLFFTTPSRLYAMEKGVAISIVNDSGGSMRLRGDNLYLLDQKRSLLLRLHPASRAVFAEAKP